MNGIGIIGLGTLGSAITRGLRRADPNVRIVATKRDEDNAALVAQARRILLCVKPAQARAVLDQIAPHLGAGHEVLSSCAAVPLQTLQDALPNVTRIARVMPNIACEFN